MSSLVRSHLPHSLHGLSEVWPPFASTLSLGEEMGREGEFGRGEGCDRLRESEMLRKGKRRRGWERGGEGEVGRVEKKEKLGEVKRRRDLERGREGEVRRGEEK